MPDDFILPVPHPSLVPSPEYRQMAEGVIANAPAVRDYLMRCAACGLPVDDRLEALDAQCQFCDNFLKNFYPPV